MREHLAKDFDAIYILDLGGNVRINPKLSGTTHNVFWHPGRGVLQHPRAKPKASITRKPQYSLSCNRRILAKRAEILVSGRTGEERRWHRLDPELTPDGQE